MTVVYFKATIRIHDETRYQAHLDHHDEAYGRIGVRRHAASGTDAQLLHGR